MNLIQHGVPSLDFQRSGQSRAKALYTLYEPLGGMNIDEIDIEVMSDLATGFQRFFLVKVRDTQKALKMTSDDQFEAVQA